MWWSSKPAASRADKIGAAIDKLDAIICHHEEILNLQTAMADAYHQKAVRLLPTSEQQAARAMCRSIGCTRQATHVNEVLTSTIKQRQALELSAVHSTSMDAVAVTTAALKLAPGPDQAINTIDVMDDLLAQVEETQSAYGSMIVSDDDALEALKDSIATPAGPTEIGLHAGATPAVVGIPALPTVPGTDPLDTGAPPEAVVYAPLGPLAVFA